MPGDFVQGWALSGDKIWRILLAKSGTNPLFRAFSWQIGPKSRILARFLRFGQVPQGSGDRIWRNSQLLASEIRQTDEPKVPKIARSGEIAS